MYGIVRIIFGAGLFGIILIIINRKKRIKKKHVIVVAIISMLSATIFTFFSVENYFFTFSTPEKAFNYINSEDVKLIVDGQESTLVVAEKAKAHYVELILPKCSNGWKLGRAIDQKTKEQIMNEDIVIILSQYKESDDYYITAFGMKEPVNEIIDSCDSKFFITQEGESTESFWFCSANVVLCDQDYWIEINNQKYSFNK